MRGGRPRCSRSGRFAVATWVPAIIALASLAAWPEPPASGTLVGFVRVAGSVPTPRVVENTTDPDVCGHRHPLDEVAVSEDGGLQHAIVALEDVPAGTRPAPARLILDNRHCRFVPRVAVLPVGSVLEVHNSDPTLHTVHLYGPLDLNLALPLQGMRVERRLDRSGFIVVKCDVHGWMQAFLRVDPHPFHAVTDERGAFRIAGIPPGEYTLSVWHETLGRRTSRVALFAGRTTRVEVRY